jgi:phage terminase large subunit GpA-like protein
MNRAEELVAECCRTLWAPPPKQTLSEWAEENFVLSPEYSAVTGKLKLYKFQRGILDSFTDPYVREIVCKTATQMIKTLFQQIAIAYIIARDPGPILAAQPTETDAETFSKERLAPMIRDCECLHRKISEQKRGKSDNTTLHKMFPGGSLSLIGAQTAGNFSRRSIRYFFADERDKWPKNVGKEGDGYSLGVKRQATFRSRAKRVQTCSPTIEGDSQIAAAYDESDQRKFWVPCPACGEYQVLRWGDQEKDAPGVKWDSSDPSGTARYHCEHCPALWNDVERWEACERGEWRAERPFRGIAGFWISELYSPWRRLGELVTDFLAKKDDPILLQTFVNTSLAETWKQQGEAPAWEVLLSRREEYRLGEVPPGVLFLTAGVDVQKTWIQGHVWGWGRQRQRWLIDRFYLDGDPFSRPVWDMLESQLYETYRNSAGNTFEIVRMAVDSGHATNEVYQWSRQHLGKVMAVDGRASGTALVGFPSSVDVTIAGKKVKHGAKLWPVNVSMAKLELYGALLQERPKKGEPFPPGWVHTPIDTPDEFFQQITAEHLTYTTKRGYRKPEWIKTGPNHDLDCANYARAAAYVIGADRAAEDDWDFLETKVGVRTEPRPEAKQEATPVPPVPTRQREAVTASSFMRSFLG